MSSTDRREYMLVGLVVQLYTSIAVIVVGAGAVYEIITQSLQPVLGRWVHASTPSDSRPCSTLSQRPPSPVSRLKLFSRAILERLRRFPKVTEHQLECTSGSLFESESMQVRQRQSVRILDLDQLDAPDPPALTPAKEDGESIVSNSVDTRSTEGLKIPRRLYRHQYGFGTLAPHAPASPASRDVVRTNSDPMLSYEEAQELRILPSPARSRVRFTQEMQISHEEHARRTAPATKPQAKPDWRYPAGYVPRLP